MKFLRGKAFDPAAEMIREELVETGKLRAVLEGGLIILKQAPPPPGVLGPLGEFDNQQNCDALRALIASGSRYIAGVAPATESHYEVTTVLGVTLAKCDQEGPLTLLDKILSTRLPLGCTGDEGECKLAIRALLIPLHDLLANPFIRNLVALLDLSTVPEEGFVSLVHTFTRIFTNVDFDFGAVRILMNQIIFPFVSDDALKTSINQVLLALEQLTAPEVGIQKALKDTIQCFEKQEGHEALYRMLYQVVINPDFQTSELLAAIDATVNLDPEGTLTDWVARIVRLLRDDKVTNQTILDLAQTVFEERNMSRLLPTLLQMGDQGVVDDLRGILNRPSCR